MFDPSGRRVARYDKMHLFTFNQGDERYDEGKTIEPGQAPVAFEAPCGRVALSICYDMRFPELYRQFTDLSLILVSSAFTAVNGGGALARAASRACHREPVLRARRGAGRVHPNGRRTFGHSLFIDPWGVIVAELETGPGIIVGDVEASRLAQVRRELPALSHRRAWA